MIHINTHMRRCHKGKYTVKNTAKYLGDAGKVVYRSRWELNYMKYCDENPAILKWNSEDVRISYIGLDGRPHKYHIDFYIVYLASDHSEKRALIEIKPHKETNPPIRGKRHKRTYLNETYTYARNKLKWQAAQRFADKHNITFIVITEKMMPALLK